VIVSNLYFAWTSFTPNKADSVLLIDSNAVLPFSISDKRLKPVTRWNFQLFERLHGIELIKLPRGDWPKLPRTGLPGGFRIDTIENVFSRPIME